MKKILILANKATGLYNFRFELIQRLTEEKYKVYFALPETEDDKRIKLISETGASYIHTPMNRRGINPLEEVKLINIYKHVIKKIEPDVILTYTIKPNVYGTYVANKYNIPVIMNITGLGTSLNTGKFKSIIKNMYKYACNKSKLVFFQNQENYNFFTSNNLIDTKKTKIIPGSGVNIDKFKPMQKTKSDNKIRFLFIGRLMKDKGIEEYLEAAAKITKRYPNIEFQILGDFEEKKYKNIVENSTNFQILYLGTSSDVRREIREVDCIVNPSYHEGMSNVLLEGAAMGKPLIASNIPGCKEIIDDGKNGFLFNVQSASDLENKIIKFLELNEEQRLEMEKQSRNKVKKEFDRNIVVNEYIKAIETILE